MLEILGIDTDCRKAATHTKQHLLVRFVRRIPQDHLPEMTDLSANGPRRGAGENKKFIAAKAASELSIVKRSPQMRCNPRQRGISRLVAKIVVDRFERIHVDQN